MCFSVTWIIWLDYDILYKWRLDLFYFRFKSNGFCCAWCLISSLAFQLFEIFVFRRNPLPGFAHEWTLLQRFEERLPNGETCSRLWRNVSLPVTLSFCPLPDFHLTQRDDSHWFYPAYVAVMTSWRSAGMKSLRRGPSSPSWFTVWGICWRTAIRRYWPDAEL